MSDQSSGSNDAASLLSSAREAASGAIEEARARAADVAPRLASAAKAEAKSRAESAKEGLVDQGERLAQSLRGALEGGDGSIQAKLMAAAADSVEDLAGSLRGRSLDQLLGDAGAFARRNPGAFVAAAALAGFAVARFARASAPSSLYGDNEGAATGSSYSSPRQTGQGYAGRGSDLGGRPGGQGYQAGGYAGSSYESGAASGGFASGQSYGSDAGFNAARTSDGYEDSSVEATPDADRGSDASGEVGATRSPS